MKKRGQVWIETVTYTLVAFVLIALVLAFAKPEIEKLQDQAIIDQSIKMMKQIDAVVRELEESTIGNKRKVEVNLKKGELQIDSLNNSIAFLFQGKYEYSEADQSFQEGSFNVTTTTFGEGYEIKIERKYSDLNLSYSENQEVKTLTQASTPYILFIENKGGINIDFKLD